MRHDSAAFTLEEKMEQRQLELENNERSTFQRLTKEIDEHDKAVKAKQEEDEL